MLPHSIPASEFARRSGLRAISATAPQLIGRKVNYNESALSQTRDIDGLTELSDLVPGHNRSNKDFK